MTHFLQKPKALWQQPLMIAPFLLWGSSMVVMRDALGETSPLFIAITRLLPAGILLLAVRYWQGRPQPKDLRNRPWNPMGWRGWLWVALFALVDGACFQGFLAEGLEGTGAGLGSVLIDSQPLAVALMAAWFYQERLGWVGWLSLLVGLAGISVIGLSPLMAGEAAMGMNLDGTGWMLLASLSMAVGTVMVRQVSRYADPVLATGWHMVIGSLPLIGILLVQGGDPWSQISPEHWLGLAYTSVLGSALAYGLFFYFAAVENLTEFSSLTFLTPVFALIFGGMFLGESLSLPQWLGVGITLLSVFLINSRFDIEHKIRTGLENWGKDPQVGPTLEPEMEPIDRG
jgi:drug/metabolite transporter (DMT)-like permease